MKPYSLHDPVSPWPKNYTEVPNLQLNEDIYNEATKILHDKSIDFGKIVLRKINNITYAFRKQMHGANTFHDQEHLGVSAAFHKKHLKDPSKTEESVTPSYTPSKSKSSFISYLDNIIDQISEALT